MKITKSQLAEAINKEVTRLNQIYLMESRLTELNRERKILSEGNILLKENYDADSIASEIDDLIDYSSSLRYDLEDKVKELLGDGSEVTSETKIEKDPNDEEARGYGENWDRTLITIKLNGKDLIKVWVNSNGKYDFGKNSIAFRGEPRDKVVSAPYGGGARFYFDRSLLNAPYTADGQGEVRKKRPRINRSGLMEGDEVAKITSNPAFQNLVKYLKQHPQEVKALEDLNQHPQKVDALEDKLETISEGNQNKEAVKQIFKDLGISALAGTLVGAVFASIPGADLSTIIELILGGAGLGLAAGVRIVANKDYHDNLGEIPITFADDEDDDITEGNLYEGELPSVSPEALIEPMETEVVQNFDGEDIDGVELIELTWQDEETLFGNSEGKEGIMATIFPDIFSREAMESYKGKEIDDYYLPIERMQLWFKLIEPIAFHYMYGAEGKWYSKSEAVNMAKERGKKYVIAQYMS
jgi:hypothetical protein